MCDSHQLHNCGTRNSHGTGKLRTYLNNSPSLKSIRSPWDDARESIYSLVDHFSGRLVRVDDLPEIRNLQMFPTGLCHVFLHIWH